MGSRPAVAGAPKVRWLGGGRQLTVCAASTGQSPQPPQGNERRLLGAQRSCNLRANRSPQPPPALPAAAPAPSGP